MEVKEAKAVRVPICLSTEREPFRQARDSATLVPIPGVSIEAAESNYKSGSFTHTLNLLPLFGPLLASRTALVPAIVNCETRHHLNLVALLRK
jgi:hypothetical protein